MSLIDIFRVITCLALLLVTVTIVLHMKARLNDSKSTHLQAFVFIISMSAFLGTASRIGGDEALVWYGAPMRAAGALIGLTYIWRTREEVRHFRAR